MDFRRVLEIAPQHAGALSDFSVLLMSQKRWSDAHGLLSRLLALQPRNPQVQQDLRICEEGLKRP